VEFQVTVQGDHALLGKGPLPELGDNPIAQGFTGDMEAHADLAALRIAYAQEIQDARSSYQERMQEGLEETPPDPSYPGFDPTSMGEMVQAQTDMLFDILEQSEDVGISLDLRGGHLDWSVSWALESDSPWGDLLANQEPKAPSGLGRVDLERPVLFWMNHDLSGNQELLQPFFEAMSGIMKGLNPEVMSQLSGQRMEGVMSMGWEEGGMVMESVYAFPGMEGSEYRDLVREQMNEMALEMPGIEMEYRQNVGQIGDMEVDVLVQEIEASQASESPFPLGQMTMYYGWGGEEVLTVMTSGEGEGEAMDRLRELATGGPGPVPDRVQQLLDSCPDELTLFGWLDMAGLMEGLSTMAPSSSEVELPEDLTPMVFYGTARDSEAIYGGSMDLKAWSEAVSAMVLRGMAGG
jgi:hypothetical protein